MSNLLANAITFNRDGGSIKIVSKIENNQLIISVQDTGIGISDKNKERIYNRFLQLDTGSVKTYGGHGLGLTVTKAMLEIIQGEIALSSEEGVGSIFTVTINQFENQGDDSGISSTDGNDFLFDQDEDDMLF
jgi:signal transduction histidine kinase